MALFESKESKEQKKQMKRDEAAAAKQAKQMAKLAEYHLDGIDSEYIDSLCYAISNLSGTGLMELGKTLSLNYKTEDNLKISFLHTIVDQNWIIIRQLDQLNKGIQRLVETSSDD